MAIEGEGTSRKIDKEFSLDHTWGRGNICSDSDKNRVNFKEEFFLFFFLSKNFQFPFLLLPVVFFKSISFLLSIIQQNLGSTFEHLLLAFISRTRFHLPMKYFQCEFFFFSTKLDNKSMKQNGVVSGCLNVGDTGIVVLYSSTVLVNV